jgi:hypothetical protein
MNAGRHHIAGKPALDPRLDVRPILTGLPTDKGDNSVGGAVVDRLCHGGDGVGAVNLAQVAFDFFQFDALPAHLNLIVDSTEMMERSG